MVRITVFYFLVFSVRLLVARLGYPPLSFFQLLGPFSPMKLLPGSFIQVIAITNLSGKWEPVCKPGGLFLEARWTIFALTCALLSCCLYLELEVGLPLFTELPRRGILGNQPDLFMQRRA